MGCVVRMSMNLFSYKNNENTAKQLKPMISELLKLIKTNEQTENCLSKRNDFHISVRQWIFFLFPTPCALWDFSSQGLNLGPWQ